VEGEGIKKPTLITLAFQVLLKRGGRGGGKLGISKHENY